MPPPAGAVQRADLARIAIGWFDDLTVVVAHHAMQRAKHITKHITRRIRKHIRTCET
jgi:hypothetical protein